MNNEVMITGSFDPVTLGHVDIIKRAAAIFEKVAVVMFINENKDYMFTKEQRLEMLKAACQGIFGVRVDASDGLVVDYAKSHGIKCVVRGIRNNEDLEYETKMAEYNKEKGGIETVFLVAEGELSLCSSTRVRQIALQNGGINDLVPVEVAGIIEKIKNTGDK